MTSKDWCRRNGFPKCRKNNERASLPGNRNERRKKSARICRGKDGLYSIDYPSKKKKRKKEEKEKEEKEKERKRKKKKEKEKENFQDSYSKTTFSTFTVYLKTLPSACA